MTRYVLDASAVLALFSREKGWEKVDSIRNQAILGTVNLAEVLTKLAQDGINIEKAVKEIFELNVNIVEFDQRLAVKTAELRLATKQFGLSLGDRACLALALNNDSIAVTADKTWSKLDFCAVEVIR